MFLTVLYEIILKFSQKLMNYIIINITISFLVDRSSELMIMVIKFREKHALIKPSPIFGFHSID